MGGGLVLGDLVEPAPPMPVPSEPLEGPPVVSDSLPVRRGPNIRSFHVYHTAHGKLTYYATTNKFEAVCKFPGHGDCRLTRNCKRATGPRALFKRHQGRCVAGCVAWLESVNPAMTTNNQHKACAPSFQTRSDVRNTMKASPAGRDLLQKERPDEAHDILSEPSDWDAV